MYAAHEQRQPTSLPPTTSHHYDPHSIHSIPPLNGHAYTTHTETNGLGATAADMQHYGQAYQQPAQQYYQPPPQQQHQQFDAATQARRNGTVQEPLAVTYNGRRYSLQVAQQPIRARMCGFGDKDRRPITPPPCIRLIITDVNTGQEIDPSEVDSTYFVLTVDLWSQDGSQEVNLVRHSSHTPSVSISTTSTSSYPPPPDRHLVRVDMAVTAPYGQPPMMPPSMPGFGMQQQNTSYGAPPPTLPPTQSYDPYPQYGAPVAPPQLPSSNPYGAPMQGYGMPAPPQLMPGAPPQPPPGYMVAVNQVASHAPASGMFTRNLIGSLSVNAFKLQDTQQKTGFWFVLQDLSVRTEGFFRLKMNFVDVGTSEGTGHNHLTNGKAPVLASCFSDVFQVYSAKKFPGVIESTPLSKAFASQGIKIPIRKEGPKVPNEKEYEDDD